MQRLEDNDDGWSGVLWAGMVVCMAHSGPVGSSSGLAAEAACQVGSWEQITPPC